jgi:hypothetical protein
MARWTPLQRPCGRPGPGSAPGRCERVQAAICTAWRAHPRTVEHTTIMAWPSLFLPLDHDARMACHMMGLNCQNPIAYPLRRLVRDRLGWSWNKYSRARDRACDAISGALNAGPVRRYRGCGMMALDNGNILARPMPSEALKPSTRGAFLDQSEAEGRRGPIRARNSPRCPDAGERRRAPSRKPQRPHGARRDPGSDGPEAAPVLAAVNRRTDLLEEERAHKRITEDEYRVGRAIQAVFELSSRARRIGSRAAAPATWPRRTSCSSPAARSAPT